MGFSRQEYWSGVPFPSPGDLPNPGIEPGSPALQEDALPSEPPGKLARMTALNFRCLAPFRPFNQTLSCGCIPGTSQIAPTVPHAWQARIPSSRSGPVAAPLLT